MKFEELTDEDIEHIKSVYSSKSQTWDSRISQLMEYLNKSERTVRKWLVKLKIRTKSEVESPQFIKAKEKVFNPDSKRFIITWAQNDTPVHEAFLTNIESYAKEVEAEIHVIAGRYKNPTSVFTDKDCDTWADRIETYLDANRQEIHKHMWIMSDVKIQPTAVDPMTGLQGMSGINSCIFGSPRVQLETIPVLQGNDPKLMLTTGACTISNYTDSKSGKKGEFHHTLGFVIVEIKDDDVFFARQVTATEDGDFNDLYYSVTYNNHSKKSKIRKNTTISAIVLGDLHYGHHDSVVIEGTLDLMKRLKPSHVILHDVFDGASISHHDINDPFAQYEKEMRGTNCLRDEVSAMLTGLKVFEKYNVVIVRSNHDDFIDRWLKNTDWRKTVTPKNSLEYMEYSTAILRGDAPNGIIPYLINSEYPRFKTLGRSDSYLVGDWELGQHGDIGSNGSRGSLLQFRKLNTKVVVGHYHSPGRKDGALSVGTSTELRVGYNIGASGWLQSHVIIHNDGKAQHINFIRGEYTTIAP